MNDTRDIIQRRLMDNIEDTFDKTAGGFISDVEMTVATELENAYSDQDTILDMGFADTSVAPYLDKIVAAYGLVRKEITYASTTVTITGTTGAMINIGDEVASDTVNYRFTESKVIDNTGISTVNVECETGGIAGNIAIGSIKYFPITLAGLISVTNTEAVTNGYEEETNEDLRIRYWDKVDTPATSGNKAQYKVWSMSVDGVGDAKVTALWNGNGTIKIAIIDSNKRAADAELIAEVALFIEDVRPIGATVTIVSATEKPINVSVVLSIDTNNYVLADVITAIESSLTQYFKDIAFLTTYVSYAKIGNLLFDVPGVLDYNTLLLNNGVANVTVANEEIAVLGVLTNG